MKTIHTWRLLALLSLLFPLFLPTQPVSAAGITVNPGSNLQTALDAAASGDTILLSDGVYYQSASIKKSLTLKAVNPGKVTLTSAHDGRFSYNADGGAAGMYSASIPWKVQWVMDGDRLLLNYQGLDELKSFTFPDTGKPGPPEGFYYDEGSQKLYVRLQDQKNPNNAQPSVNRDGASSGLTISADNVTVEGLRFKGWRKAAVTISPVHSNVTIRHNSFEGNGKGILTASGSSNHKNFLIEFNEFSAKPVYQFRLAGDYDVWQGLYNTNLNTIGIHAYTNGITVRHNYMYELFDAVQVLGWQNNTDPTDLMSDVSYNVIHNIVDNPLEFDPMDATLNIRAHHNFVFDAHAMVSLTSYQYGQALVDHNIFYASPEFGIYSYWFKSKLNPQVDQGKPVQNLTLAHNTVVLRYADEMSSRMYIPGSEDAAYRNSKIQNNIVLLKEVGSDDRYDLTGGEGFRFLPENILFGGDVTPDILPQTLHVEPGFAATGPQMDFHLKGSSPAVGKGQQHDGEYFHTSRDGSTDLGAIEYGARWEMPRPGPSWGNASNLPRPRLPGTLNLAFVGLNENPTPISTPPPGQPTPTPGGGDPRATPQPPNPSDGQPKPTEPPIFNLDRPFRNYLPMVIEN